MPAFCMISSDIPASSIGSSALSAPASAAYACNTETLVSSTKIYETMNQKCIQETQNLAIKWK